VIWGKTNCVFDELLIFNFKNLDKEQFDDGIIKISVMDANCLPGSKNTMIGAYAVDASTAYFQPDHETYRKWVALIDDEDPDDVGVQGYLKISITILGPGDKLKVHDEDEDARKEKEAEKRSGGDLGSLVMMPPNIKKDCKSVMMNSHTKIIRIV
jgi:hypothetical protein